jgi:hypothetical protein
LLLYFLKKRQKELFCVDFVEMFALLTLEMSSGPFGINRFVMEGFGLH